MGCTTAKASRQANQSLDINSLSKAKAVNGQGSALQTSFSNHILTPKAINDQQTPFYSQKKGGLQVEFINDPLQTDQITAKITRNIPSVYQKNIDQYSASPYSEKYKQANRKKQVKQKHVGFIQEKPEVEEQGTIQQINFHEQSRVQEKIIILSEQQEIVQKQSL